MQAETDSSAHMEIQAEAHSDRRQKHISQTDSAHSLKMITKWDVSHAAIKEKMDGYHHYDQRTQFHFCEQT